MAGLRQCSGMSPDTTVRSVEPVTKTRPTRKQYVRTLPAVLLPVLFGIATGYAIGSQRWIVGLGLVGLVFGLLMWAAGVGISALTWRSRDRSHEGR